VPSGLTRLELGDFTLNLHGRLAQTGAPLEAQTFDNANNQAEEQALWVDLVYRKVLSPVAEVTARIYADGYGERIAREQYAPALCANIPPAASFLRGYRAGLGSSCAAHSTG
jgi:hypothetical protein